MNVERLETLKQYIMKLPFETDSHAHSLDMSVVFHRDKQNYGCPACLAGYTVWLFDGKNYDEKVKGFLAFENASSLLDLSDETGPGLFCLKGIDRKNWKEITIKKAAQAIDNVISGEKPDDIWKHVKGKQND